MKSEIISSWKKNAKEWTETIQNHRIPSRKFTNKAILDAVTALNPKKVADFGCGEGWLTREMCKLGMNAVGFDAVEELLIEARKSEWGIYHKLSFEEMIGGKAIPEVPFDLAVFNFCLYVKENMQELLENALQVIKSKGHIVIQTLHPYFLIQNGMLYKSQWISDSWKGLPGNFTDGHSWYARIFEDWVEVFERMENSSFTIKEITNNESQPISLLIQIKKLK